MNQSIFYCGFDGLYYQLCVNNKVYTNLNVFAQDYGFINFPDLQNTLNKLFDMEYRGKYGFYFIDEKNAKNCLEWLEAKKIMTKLEGR